MSQVLRNKRHVSQGLRLKLVASLLSLVVAGCSDDPIRPEPADLTDFTPSVEVKKVWSASAGDGQDDEFLQFAPFVADDFLYAIDQDGEVYAFALESGKKIWEIDLDEDLVGGIGGDRERLYVSTLDGKLVCLNREEGAEIWRTDVSSEVMAPAVVYGTTVIVQTIDGKLTGYEASTGERRWEYAGSEPALTLRGTGQPVIVQDGVIAGTADGKLVAVSARDGQLYWEQRVAAPRGKTELERLVDVDGSVAVGSDALFAVAYQGQLVKLGIFNGQPVWAVDASSRHAPALGYSSVFVSTMEGDVVAFDQTSDSEKWRQSKLAYRELTAPVVWSNYLAVGDLEGYVHLLSQQDGELAARFRPSWDYLAVAPRVYGDKLLTLSSDGDLSMWQLITAE